MTMLVRNNVAVSGAPGGRPMVFVHGLGCDQEIWRFVAPAFEPDHRVVRFDLVGCGGSDRSAYDRARYDTLHGFADDLLGLCVELALEDVVLVGHSAGAMIGMLAAIAQPARFGALVLIGPSPRYLDDLGYHGGFTPADVDRLLHEMERNYLGWSREFAPAVMRNADRPELADALTASFGRTDPSIARHLAGTIMRSDHRRDLAAVRVPALVVQATEEPVAPQAVGEYVHAQLPDSELVLLRAAGHFPHVSAPAETVAAIHGFLQRRSGAADGMTGGGSSLGVGLDPELEGFYEHAPFGYVSTDMDWRIERINRTLLDWVGRTRAEVVGRPFAELLTASGGVFHTTHCAPHLAVRGMLREVSLDLRPPDGGRLPTLTSSVVHNGREGMPSILTYLLDASQREAREQAQLASRRRSERRMRSLDDMAVALGDATTLAAVAETLVGSLVEVFGVVDGRLWVLDEPGTGLVEVHPTTDHGTPVVASVRRVADESGPELAALRCREVIVDADRSVAAVAALHGDRPVGVLAVELAAGGGFPGDDRELLLCIGRQTGHAVSRAQVYERKDLLLSVVSHELRTPLTPILGFAELALSRHDDLSEETRHALQVIKRNGEHLVMVVDELLSVTRSRHGGPSPMRTDVDLAALVRRLLVDRDERDVEITVQGEPAVAVADPEQVTQVVGNLLANARRYGRPPIRVAIAAGADGPTVTVSDEGEGVPPAFVPQLFDEFTQGHRGDRRSARGLGLGLAIARDLVTANGGTIAYEPGTPHGACFVVSLPPAPAPGAAERAVPRSV